MTDARLVLSNGGGVNSAAMAVGMVEQVVDADERQFKMFPETVGMPCICFDGDDDA